MLQLLAKQSEHAGETMLDFLADFKANLAEKRF
jgi:hypothetical protein